MVINLAPVSLSNKKVNFYTCPRLTFLKRNATEKAWKSVSEPLDFKIFWGGGRGKLAPRPPLAALAFGARNLPHLVLKSGYGPVTAHSFERPEVLEEKRESTRNNTTTPMQDHWLLKPTFTCRPAEDSTDSSACHGLVSIQVACDMLETS